MLAVVSSASFISACVSSNAQYAFFALPNRIFEFCSGAMLLSYTPVKLQLPAAAMNPVSAIGTMIVLASFFAVESSQPGLVSLIPIVGSLLVIGTPSDTAWNSLLLLAPVEYLGRISYSAYLVHWPLYVFYVSMTGNVYPLIRDQVGLICATLGLSALLYHGVENRLRLAKERQHAFEGMALLLTCVLLSLSAFPTNGWSGRAAGMESIAQSAHFYQQQYMSMIDLSKKDAKTGMTHNTIPRTARQGPGAGNPLLDAFVIEDSHAEHLIGALDAISRDAGLSFYIHSHHGMLFSKGCWRIPGHKARSNYW
jgi:hypothetical protein